MDNVNEQRVAAGEVEEGLWQRPGKKASFGPIEPFTQCNSGKENTKPGDEGIIIKGRKIRAVDSKRQKPIKTDNQAFFKERKHQQTKRQDKCA